MAAGRNIGLRQRITCNTENTPLFHQVLMELGAYLCQLRIVLRGTLTVAGGAANGTSLGPNPANLFTRFEVDAATKGVAPGGKIKNLSPRMAVSRRIFDRGFLQPDLSLGAGGFNGAAAAYVLNQSIALPFSMPGGATTADSGLAGRPFDTALKLDAYNDVRVTATFGGRDTQFTGNDRTFTYTSTVLDIFDEREFPDKDNQGGSWVLYDEDRVVNLLAANTEFPVREQLPADGNYTDILWIAETTNQALSDAIINQVRLQAGTEQFLNLPEDDLKHMQQEYVSDLATVMTGMYYTPIVRGGRLMGALPGVSAVLDVSNPGTDRILVGTRRLKRNAA